MKYKVKAFLQWTCINEGLNIILWTFIALLAVKLDGSHMWTEMDFWAIRVLALILSLYVTRSTDEACDLAASIVRCKDCRHLAEVYPENRYKEGMPIGSCTCPANSLFGNLIVEANGYCIHGEERKRYEKSRR